MIKSEGVYFFATNKNKHIILCQSAINFRNNCQIQLKGITRIHKTYDDKADKIIRR